MVAMEVLNRDCFPGGGNVEKEKRWLNEALGCSEKKTGEKSYNGGIVNPVREHLNIGNFYYRLTSKNMPDDDKIGGKWWISYQSLKHIYNRFAQAGANENMAVSSLSTAAGTVFREWLALTFQWNLIEEIVVAELRARIDGYTGAGRVAEGSQHIMDTRGFGYAPHLYNYFTIKQICIPDLKVHRAEAFPSPDIRSIADIDRVVRGSGR